MVAHQGKLRYGIVTILAIVSGCTSSSPDSTLRIPESAQSSFRLSTLVSEPIEPEWTAPLTPVGWQAIRIEDTLLAYTFDGTATSLQAIDADSGEMLWSTPASPGASQPLQPWTPVVSRTTQGEPITLIVGAPVQQPDGSYAHPLEVRDAQTGEILANPASAWVADVEQCDLEICLDVYQSSGGSADGAWYSARLDPQSFQIEVGDGPHTGQVSSWAVTQNLTLGVTDDFLAWDVDGVEVWRTPLSKLLPEGISSADFGDRFTYRIGVDDPFSPSVAAFSFEILGREELRGSFAFSLTDGQPLWNKRGVTLCLNGQPVECPAGFQPVPTIGEQTTSTSPGTVTFIGIDAETAAPRWETTLESATAFTPALSAGPPGYYLVVNEGSPTYLDTSTGSVVPLQTEPILGCDTKASWTGHKFSNPSEPRVEQVTGTTTATCTVAGDAVDGPLTRSSVMAGAWFAWRDGKHYSANNGYGTPVEDPLDEKLAWYYVQTPTGISAYRF